MDAVFNRIEIYHVNRGNTLVVWELNRLFKGAQPYRFAVDYSRSGVGDWAQAGVVEDGNSFVFDEDRRIYGVTERLHYRVTLVTSENYSFTSGPVNIMQGSMSSHDDPLVNEILRKEHLRMTQYSGSCGFLFKRRHWGAACPDCADFDTGESKNSSCPTCYGTAITGGYFAPVPYWVSDSQPGASRRIVVESSVSTTDNQVIKRRGIACPWLDSKDVWVDSITDSRYVIQTVQDVRFRGVPVVYEPLEMRLAPSGDVIYALPRPDVEVIV